MAKLFHSDADIALMSADVRKEKYQERLMGLKHWEREWKREIEKIDKEVNDLLKRREVVEQRLAELPERRQQYKKAIEDSKVTRKQAIETQIEKLKKQIAEEEAKES